MVSSELVMPRQSEAARMSSTGHLSIVPPATIHTSLAEAIQRVSLLINRASSIVAELPSIARELAEEFSFQTVSIGITGQGWVAQWGLPHQVDFPVSNPESIALSGSEMLHDARLRHVPSRMAQPTNGNPRPASVPHLLCLPLQVNGGEFGVMLVVADHRAEIAPEVVGGLEHIAAMLATSFEREHQIEAASEPLSSISLEALLDVVSRLANLSAIDATIQSVLAEIRRLFNARDVSLLVTGGADLECYSSSPDIAQTQDALAHLITSTVVRLAIGTLQPQTGKLFQPGGNPGFETVGLAAPLVMRGEAAGTLVIERDGGWGFSREERDAAVTIARHLSFSVERERRMRSYSQQNLLLSLVERVTASVARSTVADDLFAQMAREIRRAFGYDCSIAMIDDDRLIIKAIELANPSQLPEWVAEGIPLGLGIMGKVARTGQPVFAADVTEDPAFLDTGRGTGSEIAVPIKVSDAVVGVINIESTGAKPLTDLDFEIMLILANHIGIALNNRQLIALERESRMAIEAIQRVSTIVAETLDPDESLRRIAETLGETMGYPTVSLAILEGSNLVLKASYGSDPSTMPPSISIQEGVSGRVARTGKPVLLENVHHETDYVRIRGDLMNEICVPIHCNGEVIGILNVEGTLDRPVSQRDLHLLTTFAEHAGVLLNNARAYAALSREATLDPMTGVPNLRYFQQQLELEMEQARRDERPLSLAVIDMDCLKEINDSFGHLVGDQVLREMASRMSSQLRSADILARYAGDEFVAILPGVDEEHGAEIAQRLLAAARDTPVILPDVPPIEFSASIGVATFPGDATSSTELLRAADMAMYVAKESGKSGFSTARQAVELRADSKS